MNDRSSERTYKAQNKLDANTERTSVSAKGKHIANSSEGELDSGESNGRAFHRSREISGDRKDTKVAANRQAVTTYQGTKAKKPETRRTPSVKEGRRDGKSSQSPPLTRHASDFPGHGSSPSRPTFRNSNIENRKRSGRSMSYEKLLLHVKWHTVSIYWLLWKMSWVLLRACVSGVVAANESRRSRGNRNLLTCEDRNCKQMILTAVFVAHFVYKLFILQHLTLNLIFSLLKIGFR